MKKWRKGRFSDPYMRDSLNDFGVMIDTLEASVTWDNLTELYHGVRDYIKKHPNNMNRDQGNFELSPIYQSILSTKPL